MAYIAQCQICQEKLNKNCKKEQSYDGTTCPKFRDFNRFGHMSGMMKFIFAIYIGIAAALSIFSFIHSYTMDMPLVTMIIQGFIMLYLVYAVVAFMKPLPDGAFILKILILQTMVIGIFGIIIGIVLGDILSDISLIGAFILILSVVCYLFLKRDDELDYLFPKEKRKIFVWDYIYIALQIISMLIIGIALLGLALLM